MFIIMSCLLLLMYVLLLICHGSCCTHSWYVLFLHGAYRYTGRSRILWFHDLAEMPQHGNSTFSHTGTIQTQHTSTHSFTDQFSHVSERILVHGRVLAPCRWNQERGLWTADDVDGVVIGHQQRCCQEKALSSLDIRRQGKRLRLQYLPGKSQ